MSWSLCLVTAHNVQIIVSHSVQKQLPEPGVRIPPLHNDTAIRPGETNVSCVFTERCRTLGCAAPDLVTMRTPVDALRQALSDLTRLSDSLDSPTIA